MRLTGRSPPGTTCTASRIKVRSPDAAGTAGCARAAGGQSKTDEYFGTQQVYHNELIATLPVARPQAARRSSCGDVTYQGCAEAGLCYPPITKTFNVSLPPAVGSASARAAANVAAAPAAGSGGFVSAQDRLRRPHPQRQSASGVIGFFFVAGLLLAFTPCVLPMVPILSGIIAGMATT